MKYFFSITVLAGSLAASALTLKEQQEFKKWNEYSAKDGHAKMFKTKCGYDLSVRLNENMVTPFMEKKRSAASYCDSVVSAVAGMCSDDLAKGMISKHIKSVDCALGGKEKDPVYTMAGGKLSVGLPTDATNIEPKTKTWLENNLK